MPNSRTPALHGAEQPARHARRLRHGAQGSPKGHQCQRDGPEGNPRHIKKSGIDPRKYVANPKSFTGSDEEPGALIAWIQAQKGQKRAPGKEVINLIDTSTGEIVWADEIRGAERNAAKNADDRLAAAVKKQGR